MGEIKQHLDVILRVYIFIVVHLYILVLMAEYDRMLLNFCRLIQFLFKYILNLFYVYEFGYR